MASNMLQSPDATRALSLAGAVSLLLSLGLLLWAWLRVDERAVQPMRALASALSTAAHTDTTQMPELPPAHELGSLGPAANAVIGALGNARTSLVSAQSDAVREFEYQRERLAQVLRDLDEPVLICTGSHRIKLCNRRAVELLGAHGEVGLGRLLSDILLIGPLVQALQRLREQAQTQTTTAVCGLPESQRLFHCRLALVSLEVDGSAESDYVLSIKDITAELTAYAAQDQLLTEMIDVAGTAVVDLDDLLTERPRDAHGAAHSQRRADNTLIRTTADLKTRTRAVSVARIRLLASAWPMDDIACADVFEQVRSRAAGIEILTDSNEHWARCDGVSIVALLVFLTECIGRVTGLSQFRLVTTRQDPHVLIGVTWDGRELAQDEFATWMTQPLPEVPGGLNGDEILLHHHTDLALASALTGPFVNVLQFALPLSSIASQVKSDSMVEAPPVLMIDRPEFYDFTIDDVPVGIGLLECALTDLNYVVFDTETTGLEPLKGDEIVQVAGVRVVKGRVLQGDVFDTLVNPGRQIPQSSTRIHGITDEMVDQAPGVDDTLRRFHSFAGDSILVAHNAAFDMAFLRRQGRLIEFDNQVLDTVLLSAFIFDHTGAHSLDDLARRFGVDVDPAVRHTAIGDTLVTAQVFVKLVALLRASGIETLGQALDAGQQMRAIRRVQARY